MVTINEESLSVTVNEPVIELVKNATDLLLDNQLKPLILGGEHSITTGIITAMTELYPELIMIQLDAHADLRNTWLENKHSHACTMKRCLEILPSKKLYQIAIRSGTREEFIEMKQNERLVQYSIDSKFNNLKKILAPYIDKPIYLTFDLDWFDPSIMPGTGTPEPGGYFWKDFAAIVDILKNYKLVGADIVELSPQLDHSNISSILAAKVTRTLIMLLNL